MSKDFVFPVSRPEEQGIASRNIHAFVEAVEKSGLEVHGFMLLRHGKTVAEGHWDPYRAEDRHSLFSLSKSFTSTAVGFAVNEGLLSLDDRVVSFFPEYLPEKVDENLSAMRISHLISMATGHAEDTTDKMQKDRDRNWVRGFLSLPVEYEPGTHFLYNTGATYMLSAILRKLTGQNVLDYLTPRLFKPLGIKGPTWENCPMGTNVGGWGLSVKLGDIARFGQLYLQKGKWLGRQILPEGWVDEATSFKVPNGEDPKSDWAQGYCYQFWRCRHNAYRGDGAFGQFCVVMPEQDAVFAALSGFGDLQLLLDLCWEHLLLPMSVSALPENEKDYQALCGKLAVLAYPPLKGQMSSKLESSLSGRRFKLETNGFEYEEMRIVFGESFSTLYLKASGIDRAVRLGKGEWLSGDYEYIVETEFVDAYFGTKISACAVWEDDSTFRILLRHIETPFCQRLVCRFEDGSVRLQAGLNVSFGPTAFPDIIGYAV